jgi:two-component system cell cycle sensor histidine kinase/response regulator CckA
MIKETMNRVFDPFFTARGWDFKKGTGLRLSATKGIVEQHGGWIVCESKEGVGTTFRVYFPAIEESPAIRKPEPAAETVTGRKKILLVDDEEYLRDLGKRILERAGYKVITAANRQEALDMYSREPPKISLVILDLVMPQMGGEKCIEELLKIDPKVRVLIASGYSAEKSVRETIQMGAKGFVTKPFRERELLRDVRDILD